MQGDGEGVVTGHFQETDAVPRVPGSRKQDGADPSLCRLGGSCRPPTLAGRVSRQIKCHPSGQMLGLRYLPGPHAPETEVQVDSDEAGVHASQGSILITMQTEERVRARAGPWGKVARGHCPAPVGVGGEPKGGVWCGSAGSPREPPVGSPEFSRLKWALLGNSKGTSMCKVVARQSRASLDV